MNIPGFTAEASIYGKPESYCASGMVYDSTVSVVPQARALARCHARCTGGYIGSAGACFVSGGDLCMTLAGQRFGRCSDMCDMLYD